MFSKYNCYCSHRFCHTLTEIVPFFILPNIRRLEDKNNEKKIKKCTLNIRTNCYFIRPPTAPHTLTVFRTETKTTSMMKAVYLACILLVAVICLATETMGGPAPRKSWNGACSGYLTAYLCSLGKWFLWYVISRSTSYVNFVCRLTLYLNKHISKLFMSFY